ncbi:PREDICTED: uncharacterized protein LOC105564067 [Vollenhovia emeryi]|uniref:uncharacterized protein LOC105564067 n=1 Tax=Vollenhovia emeryi TaxID=411798 RepID=UPI0005F525FD|nr:PREDICTED: uncharacterized protein LOC105564067 [Vollenhovia emeryi]
MSSATPDVDSPVQQDIERATCDVVHDVGSDLVAQQPQQQQLPSQGVRGDGVSDNLGGFPSRDQPKKSPPLGGRRVRVKMEYINDKVRRYRTFSRRKSGIMKKARELTTLTGTQMMLLMASETGYLYTFATPKLQPLVASDAINALIRACLSRPNPPPGYQGTSAFDLRRTRLMPVAGDLQKARQLVYGSPRSGPLHAGSSGAGLRSEPASGPTARVHPFPPGLQRTHFVAQAQQPAATVAPRAAFGPDAHRQQIPASMLLASAAQSHHLPSSCVAFAPPAVHAHRSSGPRATLFPPHFAF